MSMSNQELPLSGNAELLYQLSGDFYNMAKDGATKVASKRIYVINCDDEADNIRRSARKAALRKIAENQEIRKYAIDTRNIDQETIRNPRANLQYWHRSDQFIDQEMQEKLDVFSKLHTVLEEIKEAYGKEPEYHDSYARVLYGHTERTLRIKEGDKDIFAPQVSYLEQLLFARYRLSMEEIKRMSVVEIKKAILKKDEDLLKRGAYLDRTGGITKDSGDSRQIVIDGNSKHTPQNIVEAIFGNNEFRRDGEKKATRTITITITDEVKD